MIISLLIAAASVLSAPAISDVHKTSIKLLSLDKAGTQSADAPSHFAVSVNRVDSLYDDVKHRVVAARVAQVVLRFDVDSAGAATLNGAPVPLGITRMQVQAKVSSVDIHSLTLSLSLSSQDVDRRQRIGTRVGC